MKIIIDIDEKLNERIKYLEAHSNSMLDVLIRAIQIGTPLPDNATNGDVIKAMFPNGKTVLTNGFEIGYRPAKPNDKWIIWFMQDWWNAPYKRGDTYGNS